MAENAYIRHFHYHFRYFLPFTGISALQKHLYVKEEVLRIDLVGNM